MHLDYHLWRFDWAAGPHLGDRVADLARHAEGVGVRTLSVMDHYFQMEAVAPATDPMLEAYTALGYLAGSTSTLRLRTLVSGVTYRHPGLLVKIVTTLDALSGGRAELGLGAAWYQREHLGLGVPFPPLAQRFEMLEEALQICLQMWSDDDGPYRGKHYQLDETLCRPRPVSAPRPRIMIGGGGERKTLRLVAQYADSCNIFGGVDEVAHKVDVLRGHCETVRRDPAEIEVTAMFRDFADGATADDLLREAEAFARIGVSALVTTAAGDDPVTWLDETFGPVIDRLHAIEPGSPLRGAGSSGSG
jgi:F420-dependent oxidoreductase-like protein